MLEAKVAELKAKKRESAGAAEKLDAVVKTCEDECDDMARPHCHSRAKSG